MLSLEEQIERIADRAFRALEAEPGVVPTHHLPHRSRRGTVAAAVLAAAAAVGLVVVLASRGSGGDANGDGVVGTTVVSVPITSLPDSQPVRVTGVPLPPFDSPPATADPAIGTPAPVLEGKDFQGDVVTVDGRQDGATLVVFIAPWCPHCNREIPRLNEWRTSGQVPAGLRVVGVVTAVSPTSVNYPPARWIVQKEWQWPVLVDQSKGDGAAGVAAEAYGATGWPYFVLVGADGAVRWRSTGEMEVKDLQTAIRQALVTP